MSILYLQSIGEGLQVQQRAGSQGEDLRGAALSPEGLSQNVPQMVSLCHPIWYIPPYTADK